MRPFLAILKDSFRKAAASRILWVALIAITVVLIALSPLALHSTVSDRIRSRELADAGRFLQSLQRGRTNADSPAAHIWGLLTTAEHARVEEWLKPEPETENRGRRRMHGDVLQLINRLIRHPQFYRAENWTTVEMPEELRPADAASQNDRQRAHRNIRRLAAAFPQSFAIDEQNVIALYYGSIPTNLPISFPPSQMERAVDFAIIAVLSTFLGFFGVFASLLVTAGMIPETFEPGEISLLLSKPVRRWLLYVTKFIGGCVFTLICAALLVGGVVLLLWLRFDLWRPELLLCIPVYVFLFAIYFSVSALAGAVWRNSLVSLALVVVFWIVLNTLGAAQGVLGAWLMSQQLASVTVAGDEVFVTLADRSISRWDAELEDWSPILADDSGPSFERNLQQLASRGLRPKVASTPDGSRTFTVRFERPDVAGASPATLFSGDKSVDWQRESEGRTPDPVFGVFVTDDGQVLLPGTRSISRFVGLSDQEKQSRAFLNRMLGNFLVPSSSRAFEPVTTGELPEISTSASVALNSGNRIFVYWDQGKILTMHPGADDTWAPGPSRDLQIPEAALIATGGDSIICSTAEGRVLVLNLMTLETIAESKLRKGDKPRDAACSSDGSWAAILTHGGRVIVWDGTSRTFPDWTPDDEGTASAIGFTPQNELVVADGGRTLNFYDPATGSQTRSLAGATGASWHLYNYVVSPLYTVLPRPKDLDNVVNYLVTGEKSTVIDEGGGDSEVSENLQQSRIAFDLWSSFWSNFAFVAVMLLAGCAYLSRRDF